MKKYDLSVKTGTFTANDGSERGRYENIGEVHANKDGGFYARMNAFRMLGVAMAAVARGDDSLIVSLFTPREAGAETPQRAPSQRAPAAQADDFNDDIPF